jgi:hypothetical protein
MSAILLALGVLLTLAGGALIGYGLLINELSLGSSTLLVGSHAVVGGLLLSGLSAVLAELVRIRAVLKRPQEIVRPAAVRSASLSEQPVRESAGLARETAAAARESAAPIREPAAIARESAREAVASSVEPPVAPASVADAAVPAIERLRSSLPRPDKGAQAEEDTAPLSPNGQALNGQTLNGQTLSGQALSGQAAAPRAEPARPQVDAAPPSAGGAAAATSEPRLDFLFRPRPTRPVPPKPEPFEALWPKRPVRDGRADPRLPDPRLPDQRLADPRLADPRLADPRLEMARAHAGASSAHPVSTAERPVDALPRSMAILKSGVVDGMAYTLYADGSIEAQLPLGTVRFGSIAELRAHIESNA